MNFQCEFVKQKTWMKSTRDVKHNITFQLFNMNKFLIFKNKHIKIHRLIINKYIVERS
jgi:hypothetical protein